MLSATALRSKRVSLKLSQSELARQSSVVRQKICLYELGDNSLTPDEQRRIWQALQREAERLSNVASNFNSDSAAVTVEAPIGA